MCIRDREGSIAPGQKPLPVLNPQNKTAGAGFVTSSNPAVQNMIKNLDPKDVQIVQTTGSTGNTPNTSNTSNTPNTSNTNATQNPMSEEQVDEKWAGDAKIEKTGQYAGKSVAELKSMLAKLKKSGPHHKDSKEAKRMRQINFALRAKGGWKKGEGAAMKEGAKVDRMVKHIAKSERDAGKSKKDAENIAWATVNKRGMLDNKNKKKVKEADIPSTQGIDVNGAGLGAGRSQTTLEAMSPIANDGDSRGARLGVGRSKTTLEDYKLPNGVKVVQPETHKMPKAPKGSAPRNPLDEPEKKSLGQKVKSLFTKEGKEKMDKKDMKKKKAVNESMHKHNAAKLLGKAHALAKEGYNCKFEDMDEARMYHEGYKEGLDECYGQMTPIHGLVHETPAATVPGMASQAMPTSSLKSPTPEGMMDEADMDEGNAFTAALAKTPKGGKFSLGGKTFTDRSNYDAKVDENMFESWDAQLSNLLTEYNSIKEGHSIAVNNLGDQKSVNVTATDEDADKLINFVKQAALGQGQVEHPMGNDSMANLLNKMKHVEGDYADEEHSHETCNECGMMESGCGCEKESVEEMETQDQKLYQVAEDNPPDDGSHNAMNATLGNAAQNMVASKTGGATHEDLEEGKKCPACGKSPCKCDDEEETDESKKLDEWANQAGSGPGKGTDAQFTQDIEFMTKVISGGLNKPKRDQTTLPHTEVLPSIKDTSIADMLRKFHAIQK